MSSCLNLLPILPEVTTTVKTRHWGQEHHTCHMLKGRGLLHSALITVDISFWFPRDYLFYIIQIWLAQYFRVYQRFHFKKKGKKERKEHQYVASTDCPLQKHKTSSVILAWRGDRLLLKLIEWRSPSVHCHEALQGHLCSSSQKLP